MLEINAKCTQVNTVQTSTPGGATIKEKVVLEIVPQPSAAVGAPPKVTGTITLEINDRSHAGQFIAGEQYTVALTQVGTDAATKAVAAA